MPGINVKRIIILIIAIVFVFALESFGGLESSANAQPYNWTRVAPDLQFEPTISLRDMVSFKGRLYGGGDACDIWCFDGHGWEPMDIDFGGEEDGDFHTTSMAVYKEALYIGLYERETGPMFWRYDGSEWSRIGLPEEFGEDDEIISMTVYNGRLYLGTRDYMGCSMVLRFDGINWEEVDGNGTWKADGLAVFNMAVMGGALYVLDYGTAPYGVIPKCKKIKKYDGSTWTEMGMKSVVGEETDYDLESMEAMDGKLYVGINYGEFAEKGDMPEVAVYDGRSWEAMAVDVGGNMEAWDVGRLIAFEKKLYAELYEGPWDPEKGFKLVRLDDASWTQVNENGCGNPDNGYVYSAAVHDDFLYISTSNGDVWRYGAYPYPYINAMSPRNGPEGTEVVIEGVNFGAAQDGAQVVFSGKPAEVYKGWSDDEIRCEVPGGLSSSPWGTRVPVVVQNGLGSSNLSSFNVGDMPSTWYLAEGCTDGGFETWILVSNPGDSPVHVDLRLDCEEGVDGSLYIRRQRVPARGRRSFLLNDYISSYHVSTTVTGGLLE